MKDALFTLDHVLICTYKDRKMGCLSFWVFKSFSEQMIICL